jgi:hypothetical protein
MKTHLPVIMPLVLYYKIKIKNPPVHILNPKVDHKINATAHDAMCPREYIKTTTK